MKFIVNQIYSSKDIQTSFGGNYQACLPMTDGCVNVGRFHKNLNPNFPNEAWIEVGTIREKSARLVFAMQKPIPLFEKYGTGKWKFLGTFKATKLHDSKSNPQKLASLNQNFPRDPVAIVLEFTQIYINKDALGYSFEQHSNAPVQHFIKQKAS